jgi:hypothetical protein
MQGQAVVSNDDKYDTSRQEQEQVAAIRAALARKEIPQSTKEWLVSRMTVLESGRKDISSMKYVESLGLELNTTERQIRGDDKRIPRAQDPEIITVFVTDPNTGRKLPVSFLMQQTIIISLQKFRAVATVNVCFAFQSFQVHSSLPCVTANDPDIGHCFLDPPVRLPSPLPRRCASESPSPSNRSAKRYCPHPTT